MLAQRQIRENLGEQKEGKRYFLGELARNLQEREREREKRWSAAYG